MALLRYFLIILGVVLLLGGNYRLVFADLEEAEEERQWEENSKPLLLQEKERIEKERQETNSKEEKNTKYKRSSKGKQNSKTSFQNTSKSKTKMDSRLKWESSSLKADKNNKKIELTGNVKLSQDDLFINSDKAIVYLDNQSQVSYAEAVGNVQISKGQGLTKISSKSGEAVFYVTKRKIVLTKNPILWKNTDVIRGKVITYEIDSGMVTVSKVEGIFDSVKGNSNE